jgi:hypothetical protein
MKIEMKKIFRFRLENQWHYSGNISFRFTKKTFIYKQIIMICICILFTSRTTNIGFFIFLNLNHQNTSTVWIKYFIVLFKESKNEYKIYIFFII